MIAKLTNTLPGLLGALLLSACVSSGPTAPGPTPQVVPTARPTPRAQPLPTVTVPPAISGFRQPEIQRGPGLDGVIRSNAASLLRRFGTPRLDVPEGDMRKLQFTGPACVLDIFLYPLAPGAEPVATWVEARRASDGARVDLAACIGALSRRE